MRVGAYINIQRKEAGEIIVLITLKTAGSFISFHIPSTPLETKSLTKLAHHARTFDCV